MTRRIKVLILGLFILAFLVLGCVNDWDGMDRSSWTPIAPQSGSVVVTPRGE